MRIRSALLSVLCIAAGLVACATSPLGRSQLILVSDQQMEQMGVDAFEQIKSEQKISTDASVNTYVQCVARAVTDALPPEHRGEWEVRVFEDATANAFALPGNKIGVHTGLLQVAENQDQLATVLGHEVAHVLSDHGAERVSAAIAQQGGMQVAAAVIGAAGDPTSPLHGIALEALGVGANIGSLAYSRTHESEADLYGLDLMAAAGFDPKQSVKLWQNMAAAASGQSPPEFLSTHPSPETRIEDLRERMDHAVPISERARAKGKRPSCRR